MEKNSFKWWQILGMGLLYVVLVLAASFIGFASPVCWAFYSVLAALLAVGPFYWLAARRQKFGVGTFLGIMICLFCVATAEAKGLHSRALFVLGGILADVVRLWIGNDKKKALYAAYPLLAIGNIGWVIRLWTTPEWYYAGALEEMGQSYADGIVSLQNAGTLILCIILTAAVGALSVWLCNKTIKKSAALLD